MRPPPEQKNHYHFRWPAYSRVLRLLRLLFQLNDAYAKEKQYHHFFVSEWKAARSNDAKFVAPKKLLNRSQQAFLKWLLGTLYFRKQRHDRRGDVACNKAAGCPSWALLTNSPEQCRFLGSFSCFCIVNSPIMKGEKYLLARSSGVTANGGGCESDHRAAVNRFDGSSRPCQNPTGPQSSSRRRPAASPARASAASLLQLDFKRLYEVLPASLTRPQQPLTVPHCRFRRGISPALRIFAGALR